MDIPERYVWLCLRLDRHVDGFVDAYIGPSAWPRIVAAEDRFEPTALLDEARLLLDGIDGADLEDDRRRWLRGQLEAIVCITERLSGLDVDWTTEVERCLGVRPTRTDEATLEGIHHRLDAALPGPGSVRDRYLSWDERAAVPRDAIVPALERMNDVLRPKAHELAPPMPGDEAVTYELVGDVPYIAFNRYEGAGHSRIEVNADLPVSVVLLVEIAAHETYPGHHTERVAKDARLAHELGRLETSVATSSTPEALVTEGLAQLALEEALGPRPFRVVADVLADADIRFDPEEAHAVHVAERELYAVGVNAAFMLHEEGRAHEEVAEYIRTWGLESTERSERTTRFVADPTARAYVPAYLEGLRLCGAFAARERDGMTRLLTEQLTTADLLA